MEEKTCLAGSICLSNIPKELIKAVTLKSGETKMFLNVFIGTRKEPATFGERTYTHYATCAPKKEERKEGKNYFIGDFYEVRPQRTTITPEDVESAPAATPDAIDDLPF